jgi:hypothetical protein
MAPSSVVTAGHPHPNESDRLDGLTGSLAPECPLGCGAALLVLNCIVALPVLNCIVVAALEF